MGGPRHTCTRELCCWVACEALLVNKAAGCAPGPRFWLQTDLCMLYGPWLRMRVCQHSAISPQNINDGLARYFLLIDSVSIDLHTHAYAHAPALHHVRYPQRAESVGLRK